MSSESAFVKKLASNDRVVRENAIEALKQYLSSNKKATKLIKYQKLWKGLFYSMWFSDRPRPQQRVAEVLADLFSESIPLVNFNVFVEAFWSIIIKEWLGLDHHRIDKFYMLLRKVINKCFLRLKKEKWDAQLIEEYFNVLKRQILSGDEKIPVSLPMHFMDVYIDEFEKIVFEDIDMSKYKCKINDDNEGDIEEHVEDDLKRAKMESQLLKEKKSQLKKIPVQELFKPLLELEKSTKVKVLKAKIHDDVFLDERFQQWDVEIQGLETEINEQEEAEEEEEEEYFQ